MILDKIVERKLETLKLQRDSYNQGFLLENINNMPKPQSFYEAIAKDGLSIIGEIKKASPSKGLIRNDFNPVEIAKVYEDAVDAISVLTEEHFFMGSSEYLKNVHDAVPLPLLRKDFIIDEMQIYEARMLGASCVLLIVSILKDDKLKYFIELAHSLGMEALVEVHCSMETDKALKAGAGIIGINNRNLMDFSVDLNTTVNLRKEIPHDVLTVSESGIHTADDIIFLKDAGIDAILVGESFMKALDIRGKAKEFRIAYEDRN